MNFTIYELAMFLGNVCGALSLILHLAAGCIGFRMDVREEMQSCTREAGISSLVFLTCGWVISGYSWTQITFADRILFFAGCYILAYAAIVIISLFRRPVDEITRRLCRSALVYSLVSFILAYFLT